MASKHTRYMSQALQLAEQGRLTVSPNPMVGCVIVKNDCIVGTGYHAYYGGPHAEINALQEAQEQARGATAYVTLEPCCHHGKTPPCTNALIEAGIKQLYVACIDPNPLMGGKSIKLLRAAGIEVKVGLGKKKATQQNKIFFHYIKHKRPFVISKWAMSLDGKTIVSPHDDKQISSLTSQQHTHQIRQQVDAICIGARTACLDNPQLTARLALTERANQPIRIVLAGQQAFPELKLFNGELSGTTIIATTKTHQHLFEPLVRQNIELMILPADQYQQVSLPALLDELGKRNITSLLVEGGMTVHNSFFREALVNNIYVYLSPTFIGSLDQKRKLTIMNTFQLGKDFHFISSCQEVTHV